jgi:hypothetical protein
MSCLYCKLGSKLCKNEQVSSATQTQLANMQRLKQQASQSASEAWRQGAAGSGRFAEASRAAAEKAAINAGRLAAAGPAAAKKRANALILLVVIVAGGCIFLYGVGTAVPGAIAKYFIHKEKKRDDKDPK